LVQNPVPTVAFVFTGLNTGLSGIRTTSAADTAGNVALAQCGGGGPSPLRIVRFTEGFGSAFKTRVAPTVTVGSGQSGTPTQNVPGRLYGSTGPNESGLVLGTVLPNAGLADFGTRLKATFSNIPTGVRLFVSTANVTNAFVNPAAAPATGNAPTPYAILVGGETVPEGNAALSSNATFSGFGSATINIVELVPVNNSATAVWEVINNNPVGIDQLDFGVYWAFTANPGANTPPVGQGTVKLSFAPTPPASGTPAAAGAASATGPIPRFADTSSDSNLFSITLCQTALLFPYVVNVSGFDTGLAIANTTTDGFGTRPQNGTCTLNFYGTAAPSPYTTPNVATATVWADLTSVRAAGFAGYMIAVCNFQLAHGFAFISDIGARNLAMGYLALVIQTGTGNRNSGSLGGALPNSIEILGN